ncbi:hypothetical protein OROGR_026712 [Orobanche gracilis]
MFASEEWVRSPQAQKVEGKVVKRIVINDPNFWPHVAFCVKNARWTPQLHHPLHAAGYYLNPQLCNEDRFSNCDEVRDGLHTCMDKMLSLDDRLKADLQLDLYDKAEGEFGSPMAKRSRMLRSPAKWWERFVHKTPELSGFAIRVLSLTCSASGCERNWSTFESIHTKKRNRLEHQRLNALVFVKYNFKLRERSIRRRDKIDSIVVDEIDSDDEWITEKEDPVLPEVSRSLENDELFVGDPIMTVPSDPFDSLLDSDKRVEEHVDREVEDLIMPSRKRVSEGSSRGKEKQLRVVRLVDEDVEIEEHVGVDPQNFDIATSLEIDTLDDDDSDIILDENDYY